MGEVASLMKSLRSIKAVQVKFLDGRIGDDAEEKMALLDGGATLARMSMIQIVMDVVHITLVHSQDSGAPSTQQPLPCHWCNSPRSLFRGKMTKEFLTRYHMVTSQQSSMCKELPVVALLLITTVLDDPGEVDDADVCMYSPTDDEQEDGEGWQLHISRLQTNAETGMAQTSSEHDSIQ